MRILEQFLQSKKSLTPDDGGEDAIVFTRDIVAVIDGATPKTKTLYEYEGTQIAPGLLAKRILMAAVPQLDPDMTGYEICAALNGSLLDYYVQHDLMDSVRDAPVERPAASIVVYNAKRNDLLLIGDCQAAVFDAEGATHYQNENKIEALNVQGRAGELERLLASGELSMEILLSLSPDQDPGRRTIMDPPAGAPFPGLKGQYAHQNNLHSPHGFCALDGFAETALPGFAIHELSATARQIVLASDGYPTDAGNATNRQAADNLRDLQTAEKLLAMLIANDPQCFRLNPKTKGKGTNASFDDRAYLRLAI